MGLEFFFENAQKKSLAEQFGDPTHIGVDQKKSRFMRLSMRCMPQSQELETPLVVAGRPPLKQTSC